MDEPVAQNVKTDTNFNHIRASVDIFAKYAKHILIQERNLEFYRTYDDSGIASLIARLLWGLPSWVAPHGSALGYKVPVPFNSVDDFTVLIDPP